MANARALFVSGSLAVLLSACAEHRTATTGPIALAREQSAHRTYFEHQDHRNLPVGTKIYYDHAFGNGRMLTVRPGVVAPAAFEAQKPDIVVVGPYDPRASVVIERTP